MANTVDPRLTDGSTYRLFELQTSLAAKFRFDFVRVLATVKYAELLKTLYQFFLCCKTVVFTVIYRQVS